MSNRRRNRTTSGDRTFRSRRNLAWSAMRRRPGAIQTAEIAEILVHRPAQRRTGVCPRGAQVLATGGISRKPLSSMKTRWAPDFLAFFYRRPFMALPMLDGRLIALAGALDGLLAAPAEALEEAPHMVRVITNTEVSFCDRRDAPTGPHLAWIAALRRAR